MSGSIRVLAIVTSAGPVTVFVGRFATHRLALISALSVVFLLLALIAAPVIASLMGADPARTDLLNRLAAPSLAHPLGTDDLGRDVLVRLLYGGRISLLVGLGAALLAALIGSALGVQAGLVGGRTDAGLMRLTDGIIALPILPLLIILAAIDLSKLPFLGLASGADSSGIWRIVAIVALFGWTTVARLVRGAVLALQEREFVQSARALGAGPWHIVRRHLLPNVTAPIIVATTLAIGNVILAESILSFLGLGIQPPMPSWGNMLSNAQELIWAAPRLAILPGLMIFFAVIAFNFLGDGLQDALDPRLVRR
ncbi:MAG: ABC transporter permease [Pseudomonadota bacterium]